MKRMCSAMLILLMVFSWTAMADENYLHHDKPGVLFMFKKCDEKSIDKPGYDGAGCPTIVGPWPVLFEGPKTPWGKVEYNLFGGDFRVFFEGHHLAKNAEYTLVYTPAPWPAENLICLGSGETNRQGYLKIYQENDIQTGLPAPYDENFTSGLGAKLLLALSEDIDCEGNRQNPPQIIGWNPGEYLFEYNPIVFEYLSLSRP